MNGERLGYTADELRCWYAHFLTGDNLRISRDLWSAAVAARDLETIRLFRGHEYCDGFCALEECVCTFADGLADWCHPR